MTALPTRTRKLGESLETFMDRLRAHYKYRPLTMPVLLQRSVQKYPDKTALVDLSTRMTYQEVWEAVGRLMNGLKRHTAHREGKTAAVMMRNHIPYVLSYFAIIHSGGIVVPVNVRLAPREIVYILRNAGVDVILADAEFSEVLAEVRNDLPHLTIVWNGQSDAAEKLSTRTLDELMQSDPGEPYAGIRETDPAAIYYTSGTTGFPKGATISHLNMVAVARQNVEAWCFDTPDVVELEITPLFHVSFQEFGPPVFHVGGTLIVDTFSPRRALEWIEKEKVNAFFAVPSILFMMAPILEEEKFDTSSVRLVKYGGAPMPVERLNKVREMFPNATLIQGFGQTESTGMIAVTLPEETVAFPRSTGRSIAGSEMKIVDDAGHPLPAGMVGEIIARGPQIMLGYHQNDEANTQTLKDGWLYTGDLGYVDEEGRLYVVDRKKDLIIRGGQNIYAAEVEEVLYQHPDVADAAVIGKPDPILGETVMAVIIPKPGRNVGAEDIIRFCQGKLASYKVPVDVRFTDDFPRTANGKVRKVELRQRYAQS
jgi:acyl-CoA synthetase (AMP-forming)/AMP-acid ligase II